MTVRDDFAAEIHAVVLRYNLRMLAPEIIGTLGAAVVDVLTSCPAEQRVEFAEMVFVQLLRDVRGSLQ